MRIITDLKSKKELRDCYIKMKTTLRTNCRDMKRIKNITENANEIEDGTRGSNVFVMGVLEIDNKEWKYNNIPKEMVENFQLLKKGEFSDWKFILSAELDK